MTSVQVIKHAVLVATTLLLTGIPVQAMSEEPVKQAYSMRMAGKADVALSQLKELVGRDTNNARASYELARTHFYLFQFDEAQKAITRAIEFAPDNSRYHQLDGVLAAYAAVWNSKKPNTQDQVDEQMRRSLRAFEKAVATDPNNHAAAVGLVNAYLKTPASLGGDRTKAEALIKKLDQSAPAFAAQSHAILLGSTSLDKQVALYERAVAKTKSARAYAGLACVLLKSGDLERAATEANTATKLDPRQSPILLDLARSQGLHKQYDDAQETLQSYLALNPQPPNPLQAFATFYLAKIQQLHGHRDSAKQLLDRAKKLDPHVWCTFGTPPEILFEAP